MRADVKLDRIDINILAQLQRDGRISNVELAERVGLSPSPCLQRVKRLEKAGFIAGYHAEIALKKLAEHVMVFTEITLSDHRREDFVKFETGIRRFEAAQECHMVSGGYDYLLKFICPSIADYQEMMESILERNMGVEKYFSYVVLKSIFTFGSVPLKSLLPED